MIKPFSFLTRLKGYAILNLMALSIQLAPVKLKFLQDITYAQRLGEILHFSLSQLLIEGLKAVEKEYLDCLLNRALAYYPEPLPERERLRAQANNILKQMLRSEDWSMLVTLLEGAHALYKEPEAFSSLQEALLRPDFLIEKEGEWILLEFKLREEDFKPAQMEKYIELLREIDGTKRILAYLVSLDPFKLKLYKIYPEEIHHERQGLSHTSQLTLFKEFS